jgi:hypothetical protein
MFTKINTIIDDIQLINGGDGFWTIKGTRADFTYQPNVKQLVETMHIPLGTVGRELLLKIIDKLIEYNDKNERAKDSDSEEGSDSPESVW